MVQITELIDNQQFHFTNTNNSDPLASFPNISSTDLKEQFSKWDLSNQSSFLKLSYSPSYDDFYKGEFLSQLFQSDEFGEAFMIAADKKGNMRQFKSVFSDAKLRAETFSPSAMKKICRRLNTEILNLHFFDRLYDEGLVHKETDRIQKCFDVYLDHNLTVADEVRKLLICEDQSDHYGLYDETEMEEFIYQIMKGVLTGGGLNQFEDEMKPYLEAVKLIYKDMVTVQKVSNALKITSRVFLIDEYSAPDGFFPLQGMKGNFCFIAVDDDKVSVWYHAYVDIW